MRYIYVGKKLRIGVEMLPLLCIWIREDGYAALSAVAAVILHEAAHAAAAVLCGRKITSLTLTLPGADMRCAGVCSYRAELLTFLSGPAVSAACAVFYPAAPAFALYSLTYGVLNLLPAPCLDGGRALYCAVSAGSGAETAERTARVCCAVTLTALYPCAVFLLFYTSFNCSLLVLCVCVFSSYFRDTGAFVE